LKLNFSALHKSGAKSLCSDQANYRFFVKLWLVCFVSLFVSLRMPVFSHFCPILMDLRVKCELGRVYCHTFCQYSNCHITRCTTNYLRVYYALSVL